MTCSICRAIGQKLTDFPGVFATLSPADAWAKAEQWVLGWTNALGITRHRKDCPGAANGVVSDNPAMPDGPQPALGQVARRSGLAGPDHLTPGSSRVAPPHDSDTSSPHA